MDEGERFPRPLTGIERLLLEWVLPEGSPGYKNYRDLIAQSKWNVAGPGRRGEGNFLLAPENARLDTTSPLPPVIALGENIGEHTPFSIVVRERVDDQVEFEITPLNAGSAFTPWSLSRWKPGEPCPQCGTAAREVPIGSKDALKAVLALCRLNERVWVFDFETAMNHPIPHTGFYTDLMLVKNIRDPKFALDFHALFKRLDTFSDAELRRAFLHYNGSRFRVNLGTDIEATEPTRSWFSTILKFLTGQE